MLDRQWLLEKFGSAASGIAPGPAGRLAFKVFCTPPRRGTPTPGEAKIAARMSALMANAVAHDVDYADGRVRAYLWPAASGGPARGRVLLVHGWSGRAMVMGAFAGPIRAAGWDVAAFDLPAHGDSTGQRLNLALGARALQAVADQLGPFEAAITHSFGGPVTLLAAEGGPPLAGPTPFSRLVIISAPNELEAITRQFGRSVGLSALAQAAMEAEVERIARRPIAAFRCDAFLATTGLPALVIHDADDAEVALANGKAIAAAGPPGTRLMRTARLGHRRIIFAPAVVKAAVDFISGSPVIWGIEPGSHA